MPVRPPECKVPLPKGWPRRVRSVVIRTICLARFALTVARGRIAKALDARVRLQQDNERLRCELNLLHEESRIKDARMQRIPAQRRPHYPATERFAILELRAARGWSVSQTAERFLVTPATIASWTSRMDEDDPDALVQLREPVNKFPDFVGYLVRRLKVLCPTMGKAKIAQFLCRAGLHLGSTTVRRMLHAAPARTPWPPLHACGRVLTARHPNHVWHLDLTAVPTALGFWTAWTPFAVPQRWPFYWWAAAAIGHFSRRVMGCAVFERLPSSVAVCAFLARVVRNATTPKYIVTDRGEQFTAKAFRRWCRDRQIRQRLGAVGRCGSLAVIDRCVRTRKDECIRRLAVPCRCAAFRRELSLCFAWCTSDRPHEAQLARTPDEVYYGRSPDCLAPRFEPRQRWPRRLPCAAPRAPIRGRRGARLELRLNHRAGRSHLPIVDLRSVA